MSINTIRHNETTVIEQAAALLRPACPAWVPTDAQALAEVRGAQAPGCVCLGAFVEGEVVGWIGGRPEYSHAWELHPLVVRADRRGVGIGRALVAALEERARAAGALTLYLGTDDDGPVPRTTAGGVHLFPDPLAHAARLQPVDHPSGFYRRLGFVVVGLIPDANGPANRTSSWRSRSRPADAYRTNALATQPVPYVVLVTLYQVYPLAVVGPPTTVNVAPLGSTASTG